MQRTVPSSQEINPDTPLRLSVAAALAFPDGSMTASGLRRERDRGRLVVERIAGKEYTTLGDIERMRGQCRAEAKVPDCGLSPSGTTKEGGLSEGLSSSSGTVQSNAALV